MGATTDFENMVCAFMNRDATLFGVGTAADKMLAAVNMARQWAQRMHKFEQFKVMAELVVNQTTGGSLDACKLYGTATAVEARAVLRAYLQAVDGSGLYPISIITRDEQARCIAAMIENVAAEDITSVNTGYNKPKLVQNGTLVYCWPWSTSILPTSTTTVVMDIVKWLPDLDGTEVAKDIFIKYCYDWLLYRTAFHANFFLKEDQRVVINARVIEDAWDSVKEWDKDYVEGTAPVTLD